MSEKAFDYTDCKMFIRDWIASQPGRGRGEYRKIAAHLRIHSTLMSHIIRGKVHLSEDQALGICQYMGLNELETDYFLELVRLDRSATHPLRERIKQKLERIRGQAQEIKNRIITHHQLTQEDSARFYSSWHYSALRLLTDIPAYQDRGRLSQALKLPREVFNEAIQFLLEKGLCTEEGERIRIGPSRTHLAANSPYIGSMHKNWRLKAIERHSQTVPSELFYSAPMSIGHADVLKIRELLLRLIEDATKVAAVSSPETLVGLNIDWFRVE